MFDRDPGEIVAQAGAPGPERILDFGIRTGPWGDAYGANPGGLTLESFEREPNGIDMGALTPRLNEVLRTPSGQIELAPEYLFVDTDLLPEPPQPLWTGPWKWVVYTVDNPLVALALAARGADLVETDAILEMLSDPRLVRWPMVDEDHD